MQRLCYRLPRRLYCRQYNCHELGHNHINPSFNIGINLTYYDKQGTIWLPNRTNFVKQGVIHFDNLANFHSSKLLNCFIKSLFELQWRLLSGWRVYCHESQHCHGHLSLNLHGNRNGNGD